MHQAPVVTPTCFSPRLIHHVMKVGPSARERMSMGRSVGIVRKDMGYSCRPMPMRVMATTYEPFPVGDMYKPEEEMTPWKRILHWGMKGTALLGVALAVVMDTIQLINMKRSQEIQHLLVEGLSTQF